MGLPVVFATDNGRLRRGSRRATRDPTPPCEDGIRIAKSHCGVGLLRAFGGQGKTGSGRIFTCKRRKSMSSGKASCVPTTQSIVCLFRRFLILIRVVNLGGKWARLQPGFLAWLECSSGRPLVRSALAESRGRDGAIELSPVMNGICHQEKSIRTSKPARWNTPGARVRPLAPSEGRLLTDDIVSSGHRHKFWHGIAETSRSLPVIAEGRTREEEWAETGAKAEISKALEGRRDERVPEALLRVL